MNTISAKPDVLVGVDVGVRVGLRARAVERIARVRVAVQVGVVRLDRCVVRGRERAEPGREAGSR